MKRRKPLDYSNESRYSWLRGEGDSLLIRILEMIVNALTKPLYFLGASAAVGLGMVLMGSEPAPLWLPFVLCAFVLLYSVISAVDIGLVPTSLIPNLGYRKAVEENLRMVRMKINVLCILSIVLSFISGFFPIVSWGVVTFEAISLASIVLEGKVANDLVKEIHARLEE